MRDYAKVSPQFWIGKTGKSLRGDSQAQLVALYLMTSPHANMIGVFHCPILYIAHETGMPFEGASEGLQRLCEGGFCEYDVSSETVWVCEMARFQIGDKLKATDNRVTGVRAEFEKLPHGLLRQGFHRRYQAAYHLQDEPETGSPSEAPSKPLRSQEQEQEQEQENKTTPDGVVVDSAPPADLTLVHSESKPSSKPDCPHQEIIALYHELLPMCPEIRGWTAARAQALRTRWNEDPKRQTLDYWRNFFGYIAESSFLTGRVTPRDGRKPFLASLDWIVKAENFTKIRERHYEDKAA